MVRHAAKSPLALLLATTAVLSAGCFDTSSTITTADYPTRLTVDPVLFRGSLQCGAPGLARYVVTLTDVSVSPPRQLPASVPVACQNHLSFGEPAVLGDENSAGVEHAHYYTATVDGYNRDDVVPAGLGSRDMLDPSSGEVVVPTWMTTCGEVRSSPPDVDADVDADFGAVEDGSRPYNSLRYPTRALSKAEVILHGCLPLSATATPDASTGDGSADGGPPNDAASDANDVAEPDSGEPGDADGIDDGSMDDGGSADGGDESANHGGRR
jgi:hypothetical protein